MKTMLNVMREDDSLICVSSFNDHGHKAEDNTIVRRTDFFPGLGWMISRKIWDEFRDEWPYKKGHWDDWIREVL